MGREAVLPDGVRLAYELTEGRTGRREPLVYAHGLFGSRAADDESQLVDWHAVTRRTGHRLLRYDARAHGESTGRPDPADYTYPVLAADLLALLDRLGATGPVAAAGASMGCATVLTAAVRAPKRFSRLVLLIPPTAWDTRPEQATAYRRLAALTERHGVPALTAALAAGPAPAWRRDAAGPAPAPSIAPPLLPAVLRGVAATDLPAPADLAALTQPTLILAWDDDPGHPRATAERLAALLPAAELHLARDAAAFATWGDRAARFLAGDPA